MESSRIDLDELRSEVGPSEKNEQPPANIVEQDTVDSEDIEDLMGFISPPPEALQMASNVGIQYNRSIFEGWVKQPSACCGASSVAGAWNALFGWQRRHSKALNHEIVLDVYRNIMEDRIQKKTASFERKLGSKLDEEFWSSFTKAAAAVGKTIGGRKGSAVTKKLLSGIIESVICDRLHLFDSTSNSTDAMQVDAWGAFYHLYEADGVSLAVDNRPIVSESYRAADVGATDTVQDEEEVFPTHISATILLSSHCSVIFSRILS